MAGTERMFIPMFDRWLERLFSRMFDCKYLPTTQSITNFIYALYIMYLLLHKKKNIKTMVLQFTKNCT